MGGDSHRGIKAILVNIINDLFSRSIKKNVQPNLKRKRVCLENEETRQNLVSRRISKKANT